MKKLLKTLKRMAISYDKRQFSKTKHSFEEIMFIIIVGILTGCDDIMDCLYYAQDNQDFFKTYYPYKNGIPSKNTLYRMMESIEKEKMQLILVLLYLYTDEDDIISFDGKAIKGSKRNKGTHKALYIVSGYSQKNKIPIVSETINFKECEITVLPRMIKSLDLTNKIVTIDAIGTQINIINAIVEQNGNYVLPVKGNQSKLADSIETFFFNSNNINKLKKSKKSYYREYEKLHSAIEIREYFITNDLSYIDNQDKWNSLSAIGYVKYTAIKDNNTTTYERFFICSNFFDAPRFANIVRSHWNIEIMHWYLDVVFKEDNSCLANKNSIENMNIIRKFAYSLLIKFKETQNLGMNKLRGKISRKPELYIPEIFDTFII